MVGATGFEPARLRPKHLGANSKIRHPIFGAKGAGLQVKEVSLFQIRQHCSGDKGEADVPH
jgi:hypothetical protein